VNVKRLVLIGFSGAGKSTVARLAAERLGWQPFDTDAELERAAGRTIPEIFAGEGEAVFRRFERSALEAGLARDQVVIATGGGASADPSAWSEALLGNPETLVVALDAEPATVLDRLRKQAASDGPNVVRPMLAGDDPLARATALKTARQPAYDRAAVTLIVDRMSPAGVAAELCSLLPSDSVPALHLNAASASSEIVIAPGALAALGAHARRHWPAARRAWVISDKTVATIHGEAALAALTDAGLIPSLRAVAVGEQSKSWATAGELLGWLLDGGIERGDIVVALGGGVIGDLAGFVAATVLRGVALVQVPTSLLAMVDSSIGGKTGLNHRTGKNLIGAFYQPPLVVIDPVLLKTLPARELNAGWAEIVKHAVIQPSTPGGERADLIRSLERNFNALRTLQEPATSYQIRRNVALKAAVVEVDEKETGIRAYLNFGHTIGHGIEAAGYRLLHGEAIAVGIRGEMRLAAELGLIEQSMIDRVEALLDSFDLPATAAVDQDLVLIKMLSDKKRAAGRQRWVMPIAAGGVAIRDDVPHDSVKRALAQVSRPPD
jgi:shikimate kinase / 3-dehydroquinate synthase